MGAGTDLGEGPQVVEVPQMALGAVDDMCFRWVIDLGLPGPDRGAGGKYLIVPPGYAGVLPESGYHVAHARNNRVGVFFRCFLEDDDPKPVVARTKKVARVYPYAPGGYGTSIASVLRGEVPLSALAPRPEPPPTKFVEASGLAFNRSETALVSARPSRPPGIRYVGHSPRTTAVIGVFFFSSQLFPLERRNSRP